ncbi:hypothetical protein [Kribbella amoyensis]|uniref:hypothetical protein n=1 Tax=Kribbella amoyensis TaxID=996641 RepID=UPI0011AACA43|nr:hypothetical protein [Kribbella amoyensis]
MNTATARAIGYLTVVAMLPYLSLKTAWLLGSDLGLAQPDLMSSPAFVTGNLLTAAMELVAAVLTLALVRDWGRRLPVWSLLFPMWVAAGLLAPVMLAAPLGLAAELITGAGTASGDPENGLRGWVYAIVYTGFILQGLGLAAAFAHHVRARWGRTLSERGEYSPAREVQILVTVAVGILTAVVVALRLYWALGGQAGLPVADRDLPQQAMDAASAVLAFAGLFGLGVLVSGRSRRIWWPLGAAWIGSGSMLCSGLYQVVILLAPGSPFDAAGGGGLALVLVAQVLAGALAAATGAFRLVELRTPDRSGREAGPAGRVGPDRVRAEVGP